jgi:hypothetical protein
MIFYGVDLLVGQKVFVPGSRWRLAFLAVVGLQLIGPVPAATILVVKLHAQRTKRAAIGAWLRCHAPTAPESDLRPPEH